MDVEVKYLLGAFVSSVLRCSIVLLAELNENGGGGIAKRTSYLRVERLSVSKAKQAPLVARLIRRARGSAGRGGEGGWACAARGPRASGPLRCKHCCTLNTQIIHGGGHGWWACFYLIDLFRCRLCLPKNKRKISGRTALS